MTLTLASGCGDDGGSETPKGDLGVSVDSSLPPLDPDLSMKEDLDPVVPDLLVQEDLVGQDDIEEGDVPEGDVPGDDDVPALDDGPAAGDLPDDDDGPSPGDDVPGPGDDGPQADDVTPQTDTLTAIDQGDDCVAEICDDGLDNDCDGDTDLADEDCFECEPGETRPCDLNLGVCEGALEVCNAGFWDDCDYGADYEALEESCDDLDNDCNGQTDEGCQVEAVDLLADVNRNGIIDLADPSENLNEDVWNAQHGAIFLANIDDDEMACPKDATLDDAELASCNDAADERVNGEEDVYDMSPLYVRPWPAAPGGAEGSLEVSEPDYVRLFVKNGANWVLFRPGQDRMSAADLRAGVDLLLEGRDIVRSLVVWDGFVDITLVVNDGGTEVGTDTVQMRVSPVMTSHHLLDEEVVYALEMRSQDSQDYITDLQVAADVVGVPLDVLPEQTAFAQQDPNMIDQWTQDFFETGYMSMPAPGGGQHVIRVAYRTPALAYDMRGLREAGKLIYLKFRGPDFGGIQEFTQPHNLQTDSLNSFGNWETIPPYSHNGHDYPMGRLMVGSVPNFAPDTKFLAMVEAQGYQPSLHIDTHWLCVGHVDETLSIAEADTPRGWVLLANDAALAIRMMEDQVAAGNGDVLMFEDQIVYQGIRPVPAERPIEEILDDPDIMGPTAEAIVEVADQVEVFKAATGITDDEILPIPFLHEMYGTCGSLAYSVGTVNSLYIGERTYAVPETHGPVIEGKDIFKAHFEEVLGDWGLSALWVENWKLYHILMGEVHCGSNSLRAVPETLWWEVEL